MRTKENDTLRKRAERLEEALRQAHAIVDRAADTHPDQATVYLLSDIAEQIAQLKKGATT